MSTILRPYQSDVIDEIEKAIASGQRRILLVAPTGSGKTVIAAEIIGHFTQRYRPVLVLAHRLEIVTQTAKKLHGCGIRHGIIKAGFSPRPMERVQVASVQTLWVRAMHSEAMTPADLLTVDECHHAAAHTWRKIIEAYPAAVLIGLTATPCVILDHSGAVFRHGLPEDHVEWTLDADRRAEAPAHQARLERRAPVLLECSQCSALRLGGQPCPSCGFLPQRPPRSVFIADGELGLVQGGRANGQTYDAEACARWHGMLTHIAVERGYQRGWIAHKYREKFGTFPAWGNTPEPIPPTPEVRSWVRSRQIAYAKSQQGAA